MEDIVQPPTGTTKRDNKVIPLMESTRERLKNNMMKKDTYDSYINDKLDRLDELEKLVKEHNLK